MPNFINFFLPSVLYGVPNSPLDYNADRREGFFSFDPQWVLTFTIRPRDFLGKNAEKLIGYLNGSPFSHEQFIASQVVTEVPSSHVNKPIKVSNRE